MNPLAHLLYRLGLPAIALLVGAENLGIPLPTETAYVVAQTLVSRHHASYLVVLAVLQAAHFFGSWISYELGLRLRGARALYDIENDLSHVESRLKAWLDKYGLPAVFASRLVGYVRPWSSYIAGALRLPRKAFLAYSFAGSLVFNLLSLAVTRTVVHVWVRYPFARLALSLSFVVGLVAIISYRANRRPNNKK